MHPAFKDDDLMIAGFAVHDLPPVACDLRYGKMRDRDVMEAVRSGQNLIHSRQTASHYDGNFRRGAYLVEQIFFSLFYEFEFHPYPLSTAWISGRRRGGLLSI